MISLRFFSNFYSLLDRLNARYVKSNDLSILDFIMSDFFKNACIRQIHTDPNFLGGSKVFTELLEQMRE